MYPRPIKHPWHAWILMLAVSALLLPGSVAAAETVSVEFTHDGERYSVTGERTAPRTYLFNKGAGERLRIVTLNWAPYVGENICNQGWVQQLTVALLVSQGYEVESEFYPWARAVMTTETGKADILYPEYFIEEDAPSDWFKNDMRRDHLALSEKIPGGPIAFMKREGDGDYYDGDLRELQGERIGVVRGYQNTPDFDRLMDRGVFNEQLVENDTLNARKLANGRVNLIVGDPAVIRYSVANADMAEDEREKILDTLTVEEPVLQYNHLYYAVSKNKDGWENTLADLNAAISEFHEAGTTVELINETAEQCNQPMDATLEPYMSN